MSSSEKTKIRLLRCMTVLRPGMSAGSKSVSGDSEKCFSSCAEVLQVCKNWLNGNAKRPPGASGVTVQL